MTEWSPDEGVGERGGVGWGMGVVVKPHELQQSLVIYDRRVGLCSDLILPSLLHRTTHNVKQQQGLDDPQLNISIYSALAGKHTHTV